ncbi:MAG: 2-dehydropantoate 2-reductase [Nevskia sp.]|nr:2-dehydropantoate 2-reductase [Nevskia sp.]
MRTLVLGAGATGGYFGGRLLEAGRDVSFLVRARRAAQLRETGLVIRSPQGDAVLKPHLVPPSKVGGPYDLVLITCKAYDLNSAMEAVAPGVGRNTIVLPVLNGLRHFDALDQRFGAERVLGGLCSIVVTLNREGAVIHMQPTHLLRFGERSLQRSPRVAALQALFTGAKVDAKPAGDIFQALWEKWVMLASLAGMTCLMRASVGDIVAAPGGRELMLRCLDECAAVAAAHGHRPRPAVLEDTRKMLSQPDSPVTASMMRDLEGGQRVEADHILGDLLERAGQAGVDTPLLRLAYSHLKAYEHRWARERRGAT